MKQDSTARIIEDVVRQEWGRVLSILVSYTRDMELAEDVMQEALIAALQHWGPRGIPESPRAWLLQTARRKAIDRLRRDANFSRKRAEYELLLSLEQQAGLNDTENHMDQDIPDERLRLIFTCCHPALSEGARIALTLRTLGGLTTEEIARAFLVSEGTMAQRLVRAKKKIKLANIPYDIPGPELLAERVQSVFSVIYLIYNEGYAVTSGDTLTRADLCTEAIRLARLLVRLMPDVAEAAGLLSLLLLHDSRRTERTDDQGMFIALIDQDRSRWDRDQIIEGVKILKAALVMGPPGPYQIQAAISAVHAEAESHEATNWHEIALLYEKLFEYQPTSIVQLNAAVALSFAQGPEKGLEMLSEIVCDGTLDDYQPFHAALADLYRRVGNKQKASAAYEQAISLSNNVAEKEFLEKRLQEMAR
ncbi:MAG: RNA polymerase sigma factor [Proteobacteria bacterium]|nr:RNA polymerase sigma factor [Pseudomonadota bacterium]